MKTTIVLRILCAGLVTVGLFGGGAAGAPVGTGFTYQGRLLDANDVADGLYDFRFRLYDAASDGNQVGPEVSIADLDVIDGYFTAELDFGNVFDGNAMWLDICVRPGQFPSPYRVLSPRQPITATPFALHALNGGGTLWQTAGADIFYGAGKVGIWTNTPAQALEVAGGVFINQGSSTHSINPDIALTVDGKSGGEGILSLRDAGGIARVTVLNNGNVGIGPGTPSVKLEVYGQIKITGGGVGAGKVLTSDATGLASWQTPSVGSVPWTIITAIPAGFADGVDNTGLTTESDPTVASSIKDGVSWAEVSSIPADFADGVDDAGVTTESDPTVAAGVKDGVGWGEVSGIPAGFADGVDNGMTSESDPTVLASVKDGVSWGEVSGIPAGFADGIDNGITSESDPTVEASVKDGVAWSEVTSIPAGFGDGEDNVGLTVEADPKVGAITTGYFPKWNGSALVTGTIYDNGNVGIATANPSAKLEVNGFIKTATICETYAFISWIPVEQVREWQSVAMSADGTKQTAVDRGGQIYVSTDSGNTWTAKESNRNWYSVAMSADGTKQTAVVGGWQIYVSTDSGNTWAAKGSDRNWSSVAMSADGTKQTAATINGQIYISTDSGNTWTAKQSSNLWMDVAVSADGTIQTGVVNYGQIYISTDSGNTSTAKESNRNWYSVAMSADGTKQTAVVCGGQIYISTDSGNTWAAKESNRNWYSVAMSADGTKQTAVTDYGKIYMSTDSGNTWAAKESDRNWYSVAMSADGTKQTAGVSNGQIYIYNETITYNGVGIGTTSPAGKLDVNGTIYQRGSMLHADYVFESDYELESIDEHSEFMWREKHLPAIPKMQEDENGREIVEIGSRSRGVVEELEKAHIYIERLSEENKELRARLTLLDARLDAMESGAATPIAHKEGGVK